MARGLPMRQAWHQISPTALMRVVVFRRARRRAHGSKLASMRYEDPTPLLRRDSLSPGDRDIYHLPYPESRRRDCGAQ
jgi:hypothetical protein